MGVSKRTFKYNLFHLDITRHINTFITSDEIVSVTNVFIASNKRILCWRRTLLAMETNVFCAEDKHFSALDECVENACSNFSHIQTHTHTASYQQLPNETYVGMIATHRRRNRGDRAGGHLPHKRKHRGALPPQPKPSMIDNRYSEFICTVQFKFYSTTIKKYGSTS